MNKNKLIGIGLIVISIFAFIGIFFFLNKGDAPAQQNTTSTPAQTTSSNDTSEPAEYFESFGLGKLKVQTYGGPSDIKTIEQKGVEYALLRNPINTGGLEFALSTEFGTYYFAKDTNNQKISFEKGSPSGFFGYDEVGLVSGDLIKEKFSSTEYYAAYPTKDIALKSGIQAIDDTGTANKYLGSKYLKITNLNNNVSVITEIDTRNEQEGTLMISEATKNALRVDNGSTGSFSLEIVEKENNSLGVVR